MLNEKLQKALNTQINAEFWSGYFYLAMSAHFGSDGKPGFENWFRIQALEEKDHAEKLFDYIIERGGKVDLQPIQAVPKTWDSPLAAFEDALMHEREVSAMINKLVTLAYEEKDYATASFLQWFVNEQVEEESTAQSHVDALKMIKDNGFGIYTFDKELKSRAYTPLNSNE